MTLLDLINYCEKTGAWVSIDRRPVGVELLINRAGVCSALLVKPNTHTEASLGVEVEAMVRTLDSWHE